MATVNYKREFFDRDYSRTEAYLRVWQFARKYWFRLLVGVVCGMCTAGTLVPIFGIVQPALEKVSNTEKIAAIKARLGDSMKIGAGTVLTEEQLQLLIDVGGEFMVTPSVNPALIRECAGLDMAPIPGALTPSEVVDAWDAGASFVKIFPAGQMGPAYVKALKAPLAHIPMLAVAGVTLDNAAEFMKAGCVGIAVSGPLTNREAIAAGQWDRIAAVARAYVEKTVI